jgi:hypothetical protein
VLLGGTTLPILPLLLAEALLLDCFTRTGLRLGEDLPPREAELPNTELAAAALPLDGAGAGLVPEPLPVALAEPAASTLDQQGSGTVNHDHT